MRPLVQRVNLAALKHNFKVLSGFASRAKKVAVVKADVYGCGIAALPALSAAEYYAVACIEEALDIRLKTDKPVILLEGWFDPSEITVSAEKNFIPVIATARQLEWLFASKEDFTEIWIKIDTGMSRLGFLPPQLAMIMQHLLERYDRKRLILMTHFSSADTDISVSEEQLREFDRAIEPFNDLGQSLCNSAATLSFTNAHRDIVRLGIALYGASPMENRWIRPVITLETQIISLKTLPAGAAIGYGQSVTLSKPTRIAVIAIGYADGYPREYQSPPPVWIRGRIYSIIGRVSMDMITVAVDSHVSIGDTVELWGENLSIDSVAKAIGTIPYTLMTNMASRVKREYVGHTSLE